MFEDPGQGAVKPRFAAGLARHVLLETLAACAGVTLSAVATAMAMPVRTARVTVEGDLVRA